MQPQAFFSSESARFSSSRQVNFQAYSSLLLAQSDTSEKIPVVTRDFLSTPVGTRMHSVWGGLLHPTQARWSNFKTAVNLKHFSVLKCVLPIHDKHLEANKLITHTTVFVCDDTHCVRRTDSVSSHGFGTQPHATSRATRRRRIRQTRGARVRCGPKRGRVPNGTL